MKRLTGTAGSLVVIAAGIVLTLAVRSPVPGLLVMLVGVGGLAVALIRTVGGPGRRERPHRAQAVPQHDPDRMYFDALREVEPAARTPNPAAAGSGDEGAESQGSYTPGNHRRRGTARR